VAPFLANNLANMTIRYSGDRGTVWACVEAGAARRHGLGRLKILVDALEDVTSEDR